MCTQKSKFDNLVLQWVKYYNDPVLVERKEKKMNMRMLMLDWKTCYISLNFFHQRTNWFFPPGVRYQGRQYQGQRSAHPQHRGSDQTEEPTRRPEEPERPACPEGWWLILDDYYIHTHIHNRIHALTHTWDLLKIIWEINQEV